ncbi:MAG TPA: M48 family metalloprotease, partial [Chitinophagaceae bacterium]
AAGDTPVNFTRVFIPGNLEYAENQYTWYYLCTCQQKIAAIMKKLLFISSLVFTYVLVDSCARNPVTGKSQIVFMSEAQEIAMGQEADPQIIAQYGLYGDSALQQYITQKGREMAAISHRPNLTYNFRILESEVVNAFAVPGGYVYFTRGIMAYFNNEAEFTGVLGHEIGHIAARHSVEQQRNQILGQLGIIAGVIINPDLAQFADVASQGLGLLFLKFGRDAERESDRLGVEYSSKIGYDAHQMAGFFTTLERQSALAGSVELPDFLSTHPNPGDRHDATDKLATEWQQKLKLTNPKVNRNEYLRRIEGLIYGEDPKQGFLENNVFYHPELKFQFPVPAGWNYQNTPQAVQIAPKDGKALMIFTLAKGNSLQEAASNAMQQYKLQVVESRQATVNGLPALYVIADQPAQQQGQPGLRTMSYFIQYGGNIYHFIGVSTVADFNNYAGAFSNVSQNFRQLTDPAKLNKKADRIRIRTVATTGTLQQALLSFNMPQARLEELAIVNGMKLTDNVSRGTLIKIIAP